MNIQSILSSLGVESKNSGAAIGTNWLTTNGNTISSISPVDGTGSICGLAYGSCPSKR